MTSVADPACYLQIDANTNPDPDPVITYYVDADPDPTFQFDADACESGTTTLSVTQSINHRVPDGRGKVLYKKLNDENRYQRHENKIHVQIIVIFLVVQAATCSWCLIVQCATYS